MNALVSQITDSAAKSDSKSNSCELEGLLSSAFPYSELSRWWLIIMMLIMLSLWSLWSQHLWEGSWKDLCSKTIITEEDKQRATRFLFVALFYLIGHFAHICHVFRCSLRKACCLADKLWGSILHLLLASLVGRHGLKINIGCHKIAIYDDLCSCHAWKSCIDRAEAPAQSCMIMLKVSMYIHADINVWKFVHSGGTRLGPILKLSARVWGCQCRKSNLCSHAIRCAWNSFIWLSPHLSELSN